MEVCPDQKDNLHPPLSHKKEIKIVLSVIEFDYRYASFYVSIMAFCDCNTTVCMHMYRYMIKLPFLKHAVSRHNCLPLVFTWHEK